ncbi:MAG TPA: hypothetical protein VK590_14125 [Saprospiraceae bacterium]|nr:hypothetical protein [Saprospiraceae bacterium]
MTSDCQDKLNPQRIKRNGVNQDQRLIPALNPDSVFVDEHQPMHWIVFARRYARFIKYFDLNNRVTGNWESFFGKDPAAILAVAAIQNIDFYQSKLREYFNFLNNMENDLDLIGLELKIKFSYLFNCVGTLAWQLEKLKEALPEEIPLKRILKNLIVTNLAPAFSQLIRYYKAAVTNGLLLNQATVLQNEFDWEILGNDIMLFDNILKQQFSTDWTLGVNNWFVFEQSLPADDSIFITTINPHKVFTEINHVATHSLFTDLFAQFLRTYARTVEEAKKSIEASLTNMANHEPHYTLFLTFLQLLVYARDHINSFTGRHLDYYYKEILRLKGNPAEPNHAHIIMELAKHADTQLISKGTILRGGKDSQGKDVFYSIDENFVANKAKVTSFKSVFQYIEKQNSTPLTGALYASPIANSQNGLGEELTGPDLQWHPFANKIYEEGLIKRIDMPEAKIGFAIASEYFLLQQGKRIITLEFTLNKSLSLPSTKECFKIELTGEKGWISLSSTGTSNDMSNILKIEFTIEGDQPAIIPYSAKIHAPGLTTNLPVAKIWLENLSNQKYWYQDLKNLSISDISITVDVSNLKNISLSNDYGVLDSSKPFQPFGSIPVKGGSFIIGCNELFKKQKKGKLDTSSIQVANLEISWQSLPGKDNLSVPILGFRRLSKGKWENAKNPIDDNTDTINIFNIPNETQPKVIINVNNLNEVTVLLPNNNEPYSIESKEGFFKFELLDDFGHFAYQQALADYYIIKPTPAKPAQPFTPLILDISLSYKANVSFKPNIQSNEHQFLLLYPFGYTEADNMEDPITLLPGIKRKNEIFEANDLCNSVNKQITNGNNIVENEAEFYIGIEDLNPPQNLSLLFQLAEGSANPKTIKPENHVHWSYLSENKWIQFGRDEVTDRTGNLMYSGIITFSVPRNANSYNTLLPDGYHWLRASIDLQSLSTTDAICKIISIMAQATTASFKNMDNAVDFLKTQLPRDTISKLLNPEANIKKIVQPFPTFGGRTQETDLHFYTRVSERLRHKNKAVTIWDYERMILEEFPTIFKAKCLNHTRFEPTEDSTGNYNEMAPGHVTVITIPNLRNQNAIDPLHPNTSLSDLSAIGTFLRKHVSCFVTLHLHNPVYEQIRIACCVKFNKGTDEGFYLKFLKQEIQRFLSPWAFGDAKDINFGGVIYKSSLINFIEERKYVDYITDFQLFYNVNGVESKDLEEVEASTSISILVSAPAENHLLKIIPITISNDVSEKCNC